MLLFVSGAINLIAPFQSYVGSNLLIGISIILPIIIDYKSVTERGYIELWLNVLILICAFLILLEYKWSIGLFLILRSILFAKQGGLILKKYSIDKLSW